MRHLLILACLLFGTGAMADEAELDFKSNKAKAAVQKYQDASRKSNKRNLDSLIRSLEAAFKHERTEGDLDEAIKIRDTIKALEKGADPTGTPVVGPKGKKKSKTRIPRDAVKWNGHFYKAIPLRGTHQAALNQCVENGGHLAIIESKDEQAFIERLLSGSNESYWIDGSDAAREGRWMFSNGTPMSYFNWHPGEPTNTQGIEDFLVVYASRSKNVWNDTDGASSYPFICEWDGADKASHSAKHNAIPAKTFSGGDSIYLKSHHGTYFYMADGDFQVGTKRASSKMELVRVDGSGSIKFGDKIALKSVEGSGIYVTACHSLRQYNAVAVADKLDAWETFTIVDRNGKTPDLVVTPETAFALRGAHNLYICGTDNGQAVASASHINAWEMVRLEVAKDTPTKPERTKPKPEEGRETSDNLFDDLVDPFDPEKEYEALLEKLEQLAIEDADRPTKSAMHSNAFASTYSNPAINKIDRVLKTNIKGAWQFNEEPFAVLTRRIEKALGVPLVLDTEFVDPEALPRLSATIKETTVGDALSLILNLVDESLCYTVKNDGVLITTEESDDLLVTGMYQVGDIVTFADENGDPVQPDFESLSSLITNTIQPDTWDDLGGEGRIFAIEASGIYCLVVSQTLGVHREITGLLANLRQLRDTKEQQSVFLNARNKELCDRLTAKLEGTLQFEDEPFDLVMQRIEQAADIPIVLDTQQLYGLIDTDDFPRVSATIRDATVGDALARILDLVDESLRYTIKNNVVLIATATTAGSDDLLLTGLYQVDDLVMFADENGDTQSDFQSLSDFIANENGATYSDFESLSDLITNTIQPDTWDDLGGEGRIAPFETNMSLVVSQTLEVHREITGLLENLRQLRDTKEQQRMVLNAGGKEFCDRLTAKLEGTLQFEDEPLDVAMQRIEQAADIPIVLDTQQLDELIDTDDFPRVSATIRDATVGDALSIILDLVDEPLLYTIKNNGVLITTEESDDLLVTGLYQVGDLVTVADENGDPVQPDFGSLSDLIATMIQPDTWDDLGGLGRIFAIEASGIYCLVVSQTLGVHREITGLLANLRQMQGAKEAGAVAPDIREKVLYGKLAKSIEGTWQFEDEPLDVVMHRIERETGIPVILDTLSLSAVIDTNDFPRVSATIKDTTLGDAIGSVLRRVGEPLRCTVKNGALFITTSEGDEFLLTRLYQVGNLVTYVDENGETQSDFESLIDLIANTIQPDTWDDFGGAGKISYTRASGIDCLIVSQTLEVQQEVFDLLTSVREMSQATEYTSGFMAPWVTRREVELHNMLEAKLEGTWQFEDEPLDLVMQRIERATGIPVILDTQQLDELIYTDDFPPVSATIKDVTVGDALSIILNLVDESLRYTIKNNGVLITTSDSEFRLLTRSYNTRDLVRFVDENGQAYSDPAPLMRLITQTIQPDTWDDVGGDGRMNFWETDHIDYLMVVQTPEVQQEILDLLTSLRRTRNNEEYKKGPRKQWKEVDDDSQVQVK